MLIAAFILQRVEGMAQVVESLPSKWEALSSVSSVVKKPQTKTNEKNTMKMKKDLYITENTCCHTKNEANILRGSTSPSKTTPPTPPLHSESLLKSVMDTRRNILLLPALRVKSNGLKAIKSLSFNTVNYSPKLIMSLVYKRNLNFSKNFYL
jgi:hypothetical protein